VGGLRESRQPAVTLEQPYFSVFARRLRRTVRPPSKSVKPVRPEAGSISGARSGVGPTGRPQSPHHLGQSDFSAEATPAIVINKTAIPNLPAIDFSIASEMIDPKEGSGIVTDRKLVRDLKRRSVISVTVTLYCNAHNIDRRSRRKHG